MKLIQAKVALINEEQKKVTKSFLVDAETFTEAEARIAEELESTDVKSMSFANFSDFKDYKGGFFFKVVSNIITINEVSAKETKTRISTLAKGSDVETVTAKFKEGKEFSEELVSVTKINIEDIIHNKTIKF